MKIDVVNSREGKLCDSPVLNLRRMLCDTFTR